MKKRMNKHVALLLSVLMLFSSIGMNVIAVGEHTCVTKSGDPEYCNVVNPTCENPGYTENLCIFCKKVVSRDDPTSPLGHLYDEIVYERAADGTAYYRYTKCVREYTLNGEVVSECDSRVYDKEADGSLTRYHYVSFVNNKVTDTYDESIGYTKVAKTFKEEELYSCYVKHGEEIFYEGELAPYREKTLHFGEFKCIGWSTSNELEATSYANLTAENCIDLINYTDNLNQAELVLYPVFQGLNSVYEVVFYNLQGENVTWPQDVNHGGTPKFSKPNGELYKSPLKDEDIVNYYQFNGWSPLLNQTEGVLTNVVESTPIYGDVHYHPTFKPVAKNYVVEFYDETGKNLLKTSEDTYAVFEGINLEENFYQHDADVYKELLDFSLVELKKNSDEVYRYSWAGWQVMRGDDTAGTKIVAVDSSTGKVSFKGFKNIVANDIINVVDGEGNTVYLDGELPEGLVAEGKPNKEPRKVIRLVPIFSRTLETYAVDIEMQIPAGEDADYYRGEADVHVVDVNDQLAASGTTDADGKFRCRLAYLAPFTVTVATYDGKYLGTATITDLKRVIDYEDVEAEANKCRVVMQLNPDYEKHCSCIHHNALLQPIIVRIFNILYSFFNIKYVCCYDMYSTIGPLLDYTK